MVDIHAHLIYGVDDGATNLNESKKILDNAKENGVTDIIATPHFSFNNNMKINKNQMVDLLRTLKKYAKNLDINLYLGSELFFSKKLYENHEKIITLANSKYILLEFQRDIMPNNIINEIYELHMLGYKVIIAHPERYLYFQQDINNVIPFLKKGALLQGNILSLFGTYGRKSKKTLKKMIKLNMISFLSSDVHKSYDKRYDYIKKINRKVKKQKIQTLLVDNPKKILKNENIENNDFKCKRKLYQKFNYFSS